MRGRLALVAQLERRMILDGVGTGKAKGKAAGRYVGGAVPYGYRVGQDGHLEVADEQAEVVRSIFAAARKGTPHNRIANELNAAGVASPRGKAWSRQGLAALLANRTYLGELHGVARVHTAIVTARAWNAAQRKSRG